MKFEELKLKTRADLVTMFNDCIKSLFTKNCAKASGGTFKSHEIRGIKKNIARIKTALTLLSVKK